MVGRVTAFACSREIGSGLSAKYPAVTSDGSVSALATTAGPEPLIPTIHVGTRARPWT